ncbi:hypothetical protein HIM_08298 [Hirsutella minnesotensis 3608]|uniref:FAR1 domain-containing protein n=1 Tax=Hirsutella minnesotensis 3608 TaxID=1043627 RepID=A0A0F7ZYF3_9HYPO|nr:hypothetical protein HIM_08298 [Hirsutella minnesotensis 3608]
MLELPPQNMPLFLSFEDAFEAVQSHAREQWYAAVRCRPSNYRNGIPRSSACGGHVYESAAAGLRKTQCPFRLKVVQLLAEANRCKVVVMCGAHNHEPSPPSSFPEHRHLSPRQQSMVERMSRNAGMTARQVVLALKSRDPPTLANEQGMANVWLRRRQRLG